MAGLTPNAPEDAIYSPAHLNQAIEFVPPHDNALLIHLARRVQVSAPFMPLKQAVQVYSGLIQRMGRHKMFAALDPTVGAFFARMDEAIDARLVDAQRLQGLYRPILQAMHGFAEEKERRMEQMEPLPKLVRDEVVRIVRRMLDHMGRVPSSSNSRAMALDPALLRGLVTGRMMSASLAELLFDHTRRLGVSLAPAVLHQCFIAAAREGNSRLASMLLEYKTDSSYPDAGEVEREGARGVRQVLLQAQLNPDLDSMLGRLMPHLQARDAGPDTQRGAAAHRSTPTDEEHLQTMRYAWSMLLVRTGQQASVTTAHMLDLYAMMPREALCAHTLTPLMNALIAMDDPDAAWQIWLDALEMEKKSRQPGLFLDRITLAVATEICGRRDGLDAAVRLVDVHAARVRKVKSKFDLRPSERKLPLDTQNVNILIREAGSARSPSTAFRLWTASRPRWGARMNGFSLGLLMNAARVCEYAPPDDPDGFVDDVDTRWRLLLNEMDPRRHFRADEAPKKNEKYRQYEEDGFSKGDAGVLLDPPGYKWYTDYGTYRPWQRARHIFRDVVLYNWPFLSAVKSPLTVQGALLGFTSWGGSLATPAPIEHATTLPLPDAQYMHIIPALGTWQAYIRLLGTFSLVQEIPLALAWMKELGITPDHATMLIALTFVREVEGPRRLIKNWTADGGGALVRDEEILRKWLEEWLGDGTESREDSAPSVVPTEDDVWKYRGFMSMKRRRLIL